MKEWLEHLKAGKKDQILILLLLGILLVVIAWPSERASTEEENTGAGTLEDGSALEQLTEEASAAAAASGTSAAADDSDTEDALEKRLEDILSQVEGIGQTRVMITLKSDGKKVVEKDTQQSESKDESGGESESSSAEQASGSESTIYERASDGSEIPFVTEELSPEILGVLVIAQGADSSSVVTEITEAVMALFGIEAHKIKVMKME